MPDRTCKCCGKIKPLEEFRQYYGGRKGHYNWCKDCERIESRRKYLRRTHPNCEELAKIEQLYDLRESLGHPQPGRMNNVDSLVAKELEELRNGNM